MRPLSLACRWLSSHCLLIWPLLYVHSSLLSLSLFLGATVLLDSSHTLMTLFMVSVSGVKQSENVIQMHMPTLSLAFLVAHEPTCQCRRCVFDPWIGHFPWRRRWQPTPAFLPGKSHGKRSWWAMVHGVTKELDMVYWLNNNNNSFKGPIPKYSPIEG